MENKLLPAVIEPVEVEVVPDLALHTSDAIHPTQEGHDLIRSFFIKSGVIPIEVEEVPSAHLPEHKPEDKNED